MSTLYVINHSRFSGSVIEIFHLDLKTATATHTQTFSHPLIHAPNSIQLLGNGKMYVTNDHFVRAATSPFLSKVESFSALPGGTVIYTDISRPQDTKVAARVAFANGVVMLNTSTLVVASTTKSALYFYKVDEEYGLQFQTYIRTPAGPDNLSLDSTGKVLMAGHPFAPGLMQVSKSRPDCVENGSDEEKKACGCWAGSWVAEWSEESGLKTLVMDGAEEGMCSSSTAVRDVKRGVGFVSMLYGKGIVVFRE
jgi:arylesterase/paraoxonase